jgi:hypothetical protein
VQLYAGTAQIYIAPQRLRTCHINPNPQIREDAAGPLY